MNFLRSPYTLALTALLVVQGGGYYAAERHSEKMPVVAPLSEFPAEVAGWRMLQNFQVEKEVLDVLRADDTLSRVYIDPARTAGASLFVAFFKTQRTGQSPHSPKNCLPGAGWNPTVSSIYTLPLDDGRKVPINLYVLRKGMDEEVVLYWYQSHGRIIASEYWGKFYLVYDALRLNRTDAALVRITLPVENGDETGAQNRALAFAKTITPKIEQVIPR